MLQKWRNIYQAWSTYQSVGMPSIHISKYVMKKDGPAVLTLPYPVSYAGVFGAPRICPDNERIYVEQMSSVPVRSSV